MIQTILKKLLALLLIAISASVFAGIWFHQWLQSPLNLPPEHIIAVEQGDSLNRVLYRLSQQYDLEHTKLLSLYARVTNRTTLHIGEYPLEKATTPEALLDLLASGEVVQYQISLIEGKTFKDYLALLQNHDKIISETQGLSETEILALIDPQLTHPEGWFFPDTYAFTAQTSDLDLLKRAYARTQNILNDEWQNRSDDLPYKDAYEALIMASIIEKETGVAYERPEIAGVFVRRLQKKMRLQTDPTVIYGLGDEYQGNIRRKHLRQATPYNTYVIKGLPPTPIAMPGREAIHAALHPKAGETLYFVAKGDGSHYFSKTLEEHNKAVRQYQIERRREDYRSSPAGS